MGIVMRDELIDFGHQFFDATESPSTDRLMGYPVEPDLNLIQPG
jgi:hypothetical protein